jgi:LEA14-like dessication related protein
MKMTQKMIAGIILLFCLGCMQPKALVYQDVRNFRVQKVDLQEATIVLDLLFYNPNNYGLSLKNGDLDAYFNDKYLGKATLDERTAIPARDTFLLPVSVTADLRSLITNALELLTRKNLDVLVRLQGKLRAGKSGIFIGVPVHYEGRQRINL